MTTINSSPSDPSSEPATPASVADGVDHPLDPRYVVLQQQIGWISAIVTSLGWLTVTVLIASLRLLSAGFTPLLFAFWVAATIGNTWWKQKRPALEYRHSAYRLDSEGIEIRRGVFWRTEVSVPRTRVQHTEVSQGPFERRHGLGTLSIYTAGVSHSMVSLPGLEYERALRIRDYLLPHGVADVV